MHDKIKLFCFPFAGGSKYSFNSYIDYIPETIEFIPLEYPGRGARINEPLLTDIYKIVEDLFIAIKDQLNGKFAFYGHSMGTLVSFLLVKKLIDYKIDLPIHLFMTGRGGPSVMDTKQRSSLPKNEFIKELKIIGGMPKSALNNEQLMNFFEPILRADFKCIELFEYNGPNNTFEIPISVIIGDKEEINMQQAQAWEKETTAPVKVKTLPGNHFFIFDHPEEVMNLIKSTLSISIKSESNV